MLRNIILFIIIKLNYINTIKSDISCFAGQRTMLVLDTADFAGYRQDKRVNGN